MRLLLLLLVLGCGRTITAPERNGERCYVELLRWTDPETGIIYVFHTTVPPGDPLCDA
jgi:hypothetical protein